MKLLELRLHPGVKPEKPSCWRQRLRGPALRQGSLDGACGPYALFIALQVLGIATRAHVGCLRYVPALRFGDMWTKSLDTYFLGSDCGEMAALAAVAEPALQHEQIAGSTRHVVSETLRCLERGAVVMLSIDFTVGGHWVLAVGTEALVSAERRLATAILCLDSAQPEPSLAAYNGRLEFEVAGSQVRYVRYRTSIGDVRSVTCKAAIALTSG